MSQSHKETLLKLQEPASVDVGSAADYIALMKPRVMSLVVFTALVGLVMAPGAMHPVMALAAISMIAVGAGASAALNMWYDADIDAVMSRTQGRPVPSGRVTPDAALTFGLWVSGLSVLAMAVMINYLSAALLAFTIFFYAVDLHHVFETPHGAKHRHWRGRRCAAAGHWLGRRCQFGFHRAADLFRHYLLLDTAAFLGAGAD
jgi:uncharacterized membrane protein